MRRHEEKRNQSRTNMYDYTNYADQNFDRDYARNDIPDSDWYRFDTQPNTAHFFQNEDRDAPRPRGGDDLFRNNEYYTKQSDIRDRKNARLGLSSTNHSAQWSGLEGTGHYGKGPKGFKRSDDRVKEDVSEALYRDPDIDASDVEVEVKDGTVFLKGSVESRQIKRAAENCVDHLTGVEDVRNELTIRKIAPSSSEKISEASSSSFKN